MATETISQLVWTPDYNPAEQNFVLIFMSSERFDYPCNPIKLDAILRDKGLGVGDVPWNCGLHEDMAAEVLYRIEQRRTEVDISVKTKYPTAIVSTCRPERQWAMGPYHDWSSLTWVVVGTVRHNRTVGVTGYINPRD